LKQLQYKASKKFFKSLSLLLRHPVIFTGEASKGNFGCSSSSWLHTPAGD